MAERIGSPVEGRAAGGVRILPPLAEHRLDVSDSRAGDRQLDVVPRWARPVDRCHRLRLRIAEVLLVVTPGVAEVHASQERDVTVRAARMPKDDELLVVGAPHADPHVQQALAPRRVDVLTELPILLAREGEAVEVRAPDEAPDVDPPPGGLGEDGAHLAPGLSGQPLVGVAPPVGEHHEVAGPHLRQTAGQLREVAGAVHERTDQVALAPRHGPRVPGVQTRGGVPPVLWQEEPARGVHPRILPPGTAPGDRCTGGSGRASGAPSRRRPARGGGRPGALPPRSRRVGAPGRPPPG